jgi:hypothetical protein
LIPNNTNSSATPYYDAMAGDVSCAAPGRVSRSTTKSPAASPDTIAKKI